MAMACSAVNASIGVLLPLRWGGSSAPMERFGMRYAASAVMAAYNINHRVASLVPDAESLLPEGFKL
eukprot:3151899-Rhodomonas_salina.1